MANVFSEANFEDEVLKSDIPVLVDFWATWCGPCRMIAPIIDQLSTELAGKIKVGKVDVDANNGLAATYGVRTIPTLLVIKDGEIMDTMVGASSKDAIMQRLRPFMLPDWFIHSSRPAAECTAAGRFFCSWGLSE